MIVDSTDRARVGIAKVRHTSASVCLSKCSRQDSQVIDLLSFFCQNRTVLQNELFSLLGHEHLSGAAVLVFANKQDLKDAMRPAELSECLGLHTIKTHSYHIQSSCATTGEGLQEGLAWVAQKVHGQIK